jgi:phospholipase C
MRAKVGNWRNWLLTTALCTSLLDPYGLAYAANPHGGPGGNNPDAAASLSTATPIKHVIILIGENRGLDHTFGVYTPKGRGQTISNFLSKGIVNKDGSPGPNFGLAAQFSVAPQPTYYVGAPDSAKTPYSIANLMPQPNTNEAPEAPFTSVVNSAGTTDQTGPFTTIPPEPDIQPKNAALLTTGATGLPEDTLDTRIPGAGTPALANGPYVLKGPNIDDDDYTGDMTHRFYQAWQQQDCSIANATTANPSGCLNDLFPFVMATYDPPNFATGAGNFSQGNEMGFYDAEEEEASLLKVLADRFTLSDNFHQSFLGGTGANHFMFGTGDAGFWTDGNGNATTPPNNIANPNPKPGTVNAYIADDNFTNCSDPTQPGVAPIVDYLASLPYKPNPNCAADHFYMLDNTNPGFLPNGFVVPAVQGALPPSPVKTIGDGLNEKHVSWAYFGGSFDDAVALSNDAVAADPSNPNIFAAALTDPAHALGATYCQICNPFQYASSIMGVAAQREAHIKDTTDLIADIQDNTLPAVSVGKPDGLLDGHPESSKLDLFEAYVENVLDALQKNPRLKATTTVFITWDEAGGYYDSGFVQPIDFFGDGTRIPLLVLSPWSTGGIINHSYADHVSLLKFIERNWHLPPLTDRSRDNLPNPRTAKSNVYVPINSPAIDDLFDAFDFSAPPNNQPYL